MGSTPIKNITEFFIIVIVAVFALSCSTSYSSNDDLPKHLQTIAKFDSPVVLANVDSKDINESSGLIVSKCQDDVFWTHNDSGDGPFIFAFNGKGKIIGTWRVENAENKDWEDMAMTVLDGKCFIYIGDIGNNSRRRKELVVYRLLEPTITRDSSNSSKKQPIATEKADKLTFSYPDATRDAETIMVSPTNGDIYIVSKRLSSPAEIFKLLPKFETAIIQTAKLISEYTVPSIPNGFITGGDISSDGKHVLLCDYIGGYEIEMPADSPPDFDSIWKAKANKILLGVREQGEACAYSPDAMTLYATSEKKNFPLISVKRKSPEK